MQCNWSHNRDIKVKDDKIELKNKTQDNFSTMTNLEQKVIKMKQAKDTDILINNSTHLKRS